MRWPWTSSARLTDARAEIEWLRAQNVSLAEQLTRVRRHEAGMAETPKEPRQPMQPMTDTVKRYILAIENPSLRREMSTTAYRRHARGETWQSIEADLIRDEEDDAA